MGFQVIIVLGLVEITDINTDLSVSLVDLDDEISKSSSDLVTLLDELEGDEFDMKGIKQLRKMLEGAENE